MGKRTRSSTRKRCPGMSKPAALTELLLDLRRQQESAEEAGDEDEAACLDRRIGHVERLLTMANR